MILNAIVEIIPNVELRWVHSKDIDGFMIQAHKTRMTGEKAFKGFYGWVDGYGTPPKHHMDVIVLSDKKVDYGDIMSVKLVGVFKRCDGDHKLICIEREREENDFYELNEEERMPLRKLYNLNLEGDAWLGRQGAIKILEAHDPNHKKRTYS